MEIWMKESQRNCQLTHTEQWSAPQLVSLMTDDISEQHLQLRRYELEVEESDRWPDLEIRDHQRYEVPRDQLRDGGERAALDQANDVEVEPVTERTESQLIDRDLGL
jgi:hypothetical protein